MKIKSIETYETSVFFKRPLRWSLGTRQGTSRILVRVMTDDGLEGWGETHYLHFVSDMIKKVLIPPLIGEDPRDIERLYARLEAMEFVNYQRSLNAGFCALEMALWDIYGKALNLPVYRLMGGKFRDKVEMIGFIFIGDPEVQAREAAEYVRQGYKTIKMKVGKDEESDIAMIRAVRKAIGPNINLRVDPNMAWSLGTAKRILKKIEDCDLQYIEQPVRTDDIAGMAELRKLVTTPIAANESSFTFYNIAELIRARAVDVVVTDTRMAGGLWKLKKIAALCEASGVGVTLHSGAELSIGTAANLHWAASTPNAILALDTHGDIQADDVAVNPLNYVPFMDVPQSSGLGVEVNFDFVKELANRKPFDSMGASEPLSTAVTIPLY